MELPVGGDGVRGERRGKAGVVPILAAHIPRPPPPPSPTPTPPHSTPPPTPHPHCPPAGSMNMSYDSSNLTTPDIKWLGVSHGWACG